MRYPTDHDAFLDVRAATGRFDDVAAVVGPRREGVRACWCMAYRDSRVAPAERPAFMAAACGREPGPGVLVYVDDVPVGWCSVAPHDTYRRLLNSRTIPQPEMAATWSAVCFVVRAGYRGHGLMHRLLAGAVDHAVAHGAAALEGYPADTGDGRVDTISGYVGTVGLFERAGFTAVATTTGRSGGRPRRVMRRILAT